MLELINELFDYILEVLCIRHYPIIPTGLGATQKNHQNSIKIDFGIGETRLTFQDIEKRKVQHLGDVRSQQY